jgi:hypothetical protein
LNLEAGLKSDPASSQNQVTPETETAMWDIPTTISTSTQTQPPSKAIQGAPGASWNSKKGHEEYEKAFEKVLDKNWDASKPAFTVDGQG